MDLVRVAIRADMNKMAQNSWIFAFGENKKHLFNEKINQLCQFVH
jgi:hypothetical protein